MAVFPYAGGYGVDYASNGTVGFIPAVWSGKLVEKFYKATVFGAIANTDYEGEISAFGDKVEIRTVPDITITDYNIGDTLTHQKPSSAKITLLIDKGKYFDFILDDVVKKQSDLALMDKWSEDAGQQMKIAVDTQLLGSVYADVVAANKDATAGAISGSINLGTTAAPLLLTSANIIDLIVDLGTTLDEQNVPESERWLVLPAWACALIKKSDLKDASLSGDGTSMLRNGRVGMIDRFTLYMSNSVAVAGSNYQILAGHKSAITFASQMTNMESLKSETTFGTIVRGLNVYGFKVIKGDAMALAQAKKG